jgi:hypothetical protein
MILQQPETIVSHLRITPPSLKCSLLLSLMLAGLSVPGTASAQEFCSEPVVPYCVDREGEFDTTLQLNRCEDDLRAYRAQLDEYEQCISDKIIGMREQLEAAEKSVEEAREEF